MKRVWVRSLQSRRPNTLTLVQALPRTPVSSAASGCSDRVLRSASRAQSSQAVQLVEPSARDVSGQLDSRPFGRARDPCSSPKLRFKNRRRGGDLDATLQPRSLLQNREAEGERLQEFGGPPRPNTGEGELLSDGKTNVEQTTSLLESESSSRSKSWFQSLLRSAANSALRLIPEADAAGLPDGASQADPKSQVGQNLAHSKETEKPKKLSGLSRALPNTANAGKFLEHRKAKKPGFVYRIVTEQDGDDGWTASVHVDGNSFTLPRLATSEGDALRLGYLTAALYVAYKTPLVWRRYLNSVRESAAAVDSHSKLRDQLQTDIFRARSVGFDDSAIDNPPDPGPFPVALPAFSRIPTAESMVLRSEELYRRSVSSEYSIYQSWSQRRTANLRLRQNGAQVVQIIRDHDIAILNVPRGSGKTTQTPQILFEDHIRRKEGGRFTMLCVLQSVRSVFSKARFVAKQRSEPLQYSVGYEIADEELTTHSASGSITYCSSQFFLEQLQQHGCSVLDGLSHLLIDDAELDASHTELILAQLKTSRNSSQGEDGRPCKLILTYSGAREFGTYLETYFTSDLALRNTKCGQLHLIEPGPYQQLYLDDICSILRARYDVSQLHFLRKDHHYLELERDFARQSGLTDPNNVDWALLDSTRPDSDVSPGARLLGSGRLASSESLVPLHLAALVISHIVQSSDDGDVLVFLPGMVHVNKLWNLLIEAPLPVPFGDRELFDFITLNSDSRHSQQAALADGLRGRRKIIFATQLEANSQVTPEVKFIVDLGKEMRPWNSNGLTGSRTAWATRYNLFKRLQRSSVAQGGQYIALFTQCRETSLRDGPSSSLGAFLEKECLRIQASSAMTDIRDVFSATPEPPPSATIEKAIQNLTDIGAFDKGKNTLTAFGRYLSMLHLEPGMGKSVFLGMVFRCFEPIAVVLATYQFTSLFHRSELRQRSSKGLFANGKLSDHLPLYHLYKKFRRLCAKNGDHAAYPTPVPIRPERFRSIERKAHSIERTLVETGVMEQADSCGARIGNEAWNVNSTNDRLIMALLFSASPYNVALQLSKGTYRTEHDPECLINAGSVVRAFSKNLPGPELVFFSRSAPNWDSKHQILYEVSEMQPVAVLLFGADLSLVDEFELEVNGWLRFRFPSSSPGAARTILEFRRVLNRTLRTSINELLLGKVHGSGERTRQIIVNAVIKALSWKLEKVFIRPAPTCEGKGD